MTTDSTRDRAAGTAYDVLAADLVEAAKEWEREAATFRRLGGQPIAVPDVARVYEQHAERVRELVEEPIFVDDDAIDLEAVGELSDQCDAMQAENDTLRAEIARLRALADTTPSHDRRALDTIAELCGARPGDHCDNVVMVARSMLQDPAVHNARRARALAVVQRLADSLQDLIEDSPDPGSEALGAVWEGREFLRQGGGADTTPAPPVRDLTDVEYRHVINACANAVAAEQGGLGGRPVATRFLRQLRHLLGVSALPEEDRRRD